MSARPHRREPRPYRLLRPSKGQGPAVVVIGHRPSFIHDAYHQILLRSWWRFVLATCVAFLVLNALFGAVYLLEPGSVANARDGSFEDHFFFSVQTLATIGYGGMFPASRFGHMVVTVESLTGIFFIAIVTGVTFSKFSRPQARVLFSDKLVVTPRNGVLHMMFRMANARHNSIVEAQLRVVLLVSETTREGERMRRQIDIPLVRERTANFNLTWVAMHLIDEASPFFGPDAMAKLRAVKGEIFLAVNGQDDTVGQAIHARFAYTLDDIVWNARFADMLLMGEDGTRTLDYRNMHEVVMLDVPPSGSPSELP